MLFPSSNLTHGGQFVSRAASREPSDGELRRQYWKHEIVSDFKPGSRFNSRAILSEPGKCNTRGTRAMDATNLYVIDGYGRPAPPLREGSSMNFTADGFLLSTGENGYS